MLTTMLGDLIDVVGGSENCILGPLMDPISKIIEIYENASLIR